MMGEVGFDIQKNANTVVAGGTKNTMAGHSARFVMAPGVGYFVLSNLAVGGQVGYSFTSDWDDDMADRSHLFEMVPFVRYNILSFGKFGLFAKAEIGLGFGWGTNIAKGSGGTTSTDKPTQFNFRIGVVPGLFYDASEHFQLYTAINLLNFGLTYSSSTSKEDSDNWSRNSTTTFVMGVNTENIFTLGAITAGAIIKL